MSESITLLGRVIAQLRYRTGLDAVRAFNLARRWLRERAEEGLPDRDAYQIALEIMDREQLPVAK